MLFFSFSKFRIIFFSPRTQRIVLMLVCLFQGTYVYVFKKIDIKDCHSTAFNLYPQPQKFVLFDQRTIDM